MADEAKQIVDNFMKVIAYAQALEDLLVEKGIITHAEAAAHYRLKLAETGDRLDSESILQLARFDGPTQ
jgi:hypothetical protein